MKNKTQNTYYLMRSHKKISSKVTGNHNEQRKQQQNQQAPQTSASTVRKSTSLSRPLK